MILLLVTGIQIKSLFNLIPFDLLFIPTLLQMSNYKRNADLNRDALFGPASTGGGTRRGGNSNRTAKKPSSSQQVSSSSSTIAASNFSPSLPKTGPRRTNNLITSLSGAAKVEKMKEAEDYRKKAKNAMTKTLFSSIDPIAGGMFYHRAAEAYKLCGENRLERLHRIASGDCQLGHGAYGTAAQEYIRAAELCEMSDEKEGRKKAECTKLYKDAANAWKEAGELGRSGECEFKSAFSLLLGNTSSADDEDDENDEDDDDDQIVIGGRKLMTMNKEALAAIEAAVENFVPDPLNKYKDFRQTGISAFVDPEATEENQDDEEALMAMCESHLITSSYTNEILFQAVQQFIAYGEYKSALYTAGAITAVLQHEGYATISLSRAFCHETILALAMGDVVTADKFFLQVHLQNNNYLTSRECKLAEDLIRAVKMRDVNDLEIARDPGGENRGALANLDTNLRTLVAGLRISGAIKKPMPAPAAEPSASAPASMSAGNEGQGNDVHDELDNLMNDMGLGDDDEDDDDLDLT